MIWQFLDLSRGYDTAVREVLLGWKQGFCEDPIVYLMELGLDRPTAAHIAEEVARDGGLFKSRGIRQGTIEMIKSLHTNSCFKYSDLDSIIVTGLGAR